MASDHSDSLVRGWKAGSHMSDCVTGGGVRDSSTERTATLEREHSGNLRGVWEEGPMYRLCATKRLFLGQADCQNAQ